MKVFHHNESCLACPHPPSSYGGKREQEGSSHFDKKTLILIGHYGIASLIRHAVILCVKMGGRGKEMSVLYFNIMTAVAYGSYMTVE